MTLGATSTRVLPLQQAELSVQRGRRSFDGRRGDAPGLARLVEETRDAPHFGSHPRLDRPPGRCAEGRAVCRQGFARDGQATRGVVDRADELLMDVFGSSSHAGLSCKWGAIGASAARDQRRLA